MCDPASFLAITAAIAALVSGLKDGKSLYSEWLKKRRTKAARNQHRLLEDFDKSLAAIQSEYVRNRASLGIRFDKGDGTLKPIMFRAA